METRTRELYARLVKDLTKEPGVTFPLQEPGARKSFGDGALHVDGKIFCMVDSRGRFVVKLPAAQVKTLLANGQGAPFEMGKAKWAKEWVVLVEGTEETWENHAKEALTFVKTLAQKK